jgi:hypothetical protein
MTISRHGFSSIKLENSYTLRTKKEKKNNNSSYRKNNVSTFIDTEPLDFESFYYTMLHAHNDNLLSSDPLGPNKPLGPHFLYLYDRSNRIAHSICIHLDYKSSKEADKDLKNLPVSMLNIAAETKSDYCVSFNRYWTKTDEALKLEEHLNKESRCWDHLSPELKKEFTEVMGHSDSCNFIINNNSSGAGRSCNCNGNDRNRSKWMIEIMVVIGRSCTIDNNNNSNSSSTKEIVKTYRVMRKIPNDQTSKILNLHEIPNRAITELTARAVATH